MDEARKGSRHGLRRALAFALAFLTVVIGVVAYSPKDQAAQAAVKPIVVVDPGHGYKNGAAESGAIAPDGTREATLNVQLAGRVAAALKAKGYTVYSTLDVGGGIPNLIDSLKPNITLEGRASAANQIGADLFISVHHNSFGNGGYNTAAGTIVLHDPLQHKTAMRAKSQALATAVYGAVSALPGAKGNRYKNVVAQEATVLQDNNAPAITLEAGFLTNSADLVRVKSPDNQAKMAAKVAEGVAAYFAKYPPESKSNDSNPPTVEEMRTSANPTKKPTFSVAAYGVKDETGVKAVEYLVYPTGKRSKAKTVKATNKGNGKWLANISVSKLFGDIGGLYIVDVYTTDTVGNKGLEERVRMTYAKDMSKPTVEKILTSATPTRRPVFSVAAYGVKDESGVKSVTYKVYPTRHASSAKTVKGANKGNGKWLANINAGKLFNDKGGLYIVDIYAEDKKGNSGRIGRVRMTYQRDNTPPTLDKVMTSANPSKNPVFSVAAYGVADESGVKSVTYKVYPTRHASSAKTVAAKHKGSGKWVATMNFKSMFGDKGGLYIVDIYAEDKKGNSKRVGRIRLTYDKQTAANSYYILGSSSVTASQLKDYYVRTVGAGAYPYASEASLGSFCSMYVSECKKYGIKPEVAFAQMLLETNYLRYGGDVDVKQRNFAGIGATGGVPGSDFADLRTGIRAQVQHLYAYASKNALPETQVDPRFQMVPRGSATTVGELSQKWAAGATYGDNILKIITAIK